MKSTTPAKSDSVGKIDKVDATAAFHQSTGGKWISIFKAFNPLGHLADVYAQTLAYKIECKRLDVELIRIEKQAEIANNLIDKTYRLKLEELQQRRIALVGFFNTVDRQLERLHLERMKAQEMRDMVAKKVLEPGLDIEERRLFKEMTVEMNAHLVALGNNANESLKTLVQALPPVQIPPALLSDNQG